MEIPSGLIFAARHLAKRQAWHWFRRDTSTIHFPPSLHVYSRFLLKLNRIGTFHSTCYYKCIASYVYVEIINFWRLTVECCVWKIHGIRHTMVLHSVCHLLYRHILYNGCSCHVMRLFAILIPATSSRFILWFLTILCKFSIIFLLEKMGKCVV